MELSLAPEGAAFLAADPILNGPRARMPSPNPARDLSHPHIPHGVKQRGGHAVKYEERTGCWQLALFIIFVFIAAFASLETNQLEKEMVPLMMPPPQSPEARGTFGHHAQVLSFRFPPCGPPPLPARKWWRALSSELRQEEPSASERKRRRS